jgi:hypothetical protein
MWLCSVVSCVPDALDYLHTIMRISVSEGPAHYSVAKQTKTYDGKTMFSITIPYYAIL